MALRILIICVQLALLQVNIAVSDVYLSLTVPNTATNVVAYNSSYLRAGSILSGPTDNSADHFVVTCSVAGSNQSNIGQWYYPDGSLVGDSPLAPQTAGVSQQRQQGGVILYRYGCLECSSQVGVYWCVIPDLSGIARSLYVGLYNIYASGRPISNAAQGGPVIVGGACKYILITLPHINPPVFQLTCTSSNSPATVVVWTLNGSLVSPSSTASSQTITNLTYAVYSNVLVVTGRSAGLYVCNVTTHRFEVPNNSDGVGNDTWIGGPALGNITVEDSPGPVNISNVFQLGTTLSVSWTAPVSGGAVYSYWVYVNAGRSLPSTTTSVTLQLSAGQQYTIQVVAVGKHLPSLPSTVVVELVTPPYVSITRSQPYANAGASFTLTCHVQFPSAPTSPVQIWWANSTDFILNSTAVQGSRTLHTLDFTIAQLKASDGGLYKCGIVVAKYGTSSNTTVIVQVPAPAVMAVASSTFLIVGNPFQLNCTGQLPKYFNVPCNVTTTWTAPNGVPVSTSSHSTIGGIFTTPVWSSLAANLSIAGTYMCSMSVRFNDPRFLNLSNTTTFDQVIIVVTAGPLLLNITRPGTPAQLGMSYSLLCSVTVPMISKTFDLSISWKSATTMIKNMTFKNTTPAVYELQLPFDSVNTSQVGVYWCEADLGPLSTVALQNISVVVPQPTVTLVSSSGLYIVAGDVLSLTCGIQLDAFKYIDTEIMLNIMWRYPSARDNKTSQLVSPTAEPLSFISTLQLQSGGLGDAGNYSCLITLQPQQDSMFLTSSIPVEATVEVNVLESNLTMYISDTEPALGYPYTLTCQVNVPGISTPLLSLQLELSFFTDASNISLQDDTIADPGNSTHQLQLVLPSLSTADAGMYVCLASVGPYKVMGTKVIILRVPPPTLNVLAEPLSFIVVQQSLTLLCSGMLSLSVNTDVSINVSWSDPLGLVLKTEQEVQLSSDQKIQSQLSLPSLPFSGAGNYTCLVTIIPLSSPMYVYGIHTTSQVEIVIMNGNMTVAIISGYGKPPQLGSPYSLSCNINVPALSMSGQTLQLEWMLFTDTSNYSLNKTVIADPGNATHQYQLSLKSLSTADAGIYVCLGSVGPYSVNGSVVIASQVPPPILIVTAEPTDFIVAQQNLTLLCSISLPLSMKTRIEMNVSWINPTGQTVQNDPTLQLPGNSSIESRLSLPSVPFSGAGNYTCLVSTSPQPAFIYSSQIEISIINGNMTVAISGYGKPPQFGSPYSLSCNINVPALSTRRQALQLEWMLFTDTSTYSLNKTVIADPGNATHQLQLSLQPLSTDDAGTYVCLATVGSWVARNTTEIVLKVASPDLMISAIPNNTDIAAGSNITLNCCATVSTHIHDGFSMNFTWLGPDGKRLTYTNLSVNSSSLTCSEISLTVQSTGVYTCSANVYSSFPSAFILDSTSTIKQQSIVVYSEIQTPACKSPGSLQGIAKKLCGLLTGTPLGISEGVLSITNNISALDSKDVAIVVGILAELVQPSANDSKMQDNIVSIVTNLLDVDKEILYESMTNPLLVKTIENFTKIVDVVEGIKTFTQDKFVLQAQDLPASQSEFVVLNKSFSTPNMTNSKLITQEASIILPSTLFGELNTTSGTVRASSSIFLNDLLFQPQQNISRQFSNYSLGSLIVSASLNLAFPVKNLKNPVTILLTIGSDTIQNQNESNITCVFWDTAANGGFGDWSTEGCHLVSSRNAMAVCKCNHLTSFAILFDVSPKAKPNALVGLGVQIITFVGLSVSIVCLLVIITTYIVSRKLRTSILGKMLLNLCGSLLAIFVVFIASSVAPPVHALCSLLSALLHYTLLAYFFWTAAEAIHLYLKLVQVFETRWLHRHYVAIAMAVCWGAPLIIVSISLSGYKDYGNGQFCRPYQLPFYIGFVLPFGIIYVFNWVMFVITFASICHHVTRNNTTAYETFKKQFKIAVTISLLLGLGWAFGFLGTSALPKEIYIPAQYFFSFFMTSQGALFLFFHGIKSAEVRQEWMRLFYVATGRSDKYRLYLQNSKTKATDSAHKSNVTTLSKMKSKAYSVEESHASTDMELKVNPEKLSGDALGKETMPQESCCYAWDENEKEKSPSTDEPHAPSKGPEHTCIAIPSEKETTPQVVTETCCDETSPSTGNQMMPSQEPEYAGVGIKPEKDYVIEGNDGQITFNILYMPVVSHEKEQKSDGNNSGPDSNTQAAAGLY